MTFQLQAIALITFAPLALLTTTSIACGETVENLFGTGGIWVIWICLSVHTGNFLYSGFGLAIFRHACINYSLVTYEE